MITSFAEITPEAAAVRETPTGSRSFYARYFFVGMALLFIVVTALGFVPQLMVIHAQHIPLHWFTHVHGAVMTGWLLLYLTQAVLAATGRVKYHKQLGIFSAGYGAVVWITMPVVTVASLIRNNPPEGDGQFNIVALSFTAVALFGFFFTWGLRARRNAALHKRLLLLAMLPVMSAGVDRIAWLPGIGGAFFVRYLYLDALLIPLLAYDLVVGQRIHRMTGIGVVVLMVSQAITAVVAVSPAWHRFAYTAITPFVERLPEVQLTEAQAEPLLGDYGGKDWHMTVSRDGGKLYLQLPDQPKWELGANSETRLFLKENTWRLEFVKDAAGRVLKVINHQPAQTWEAGKI